MTLSDSATLAEAKRRPPRRGGCFAPQPAPSAGATISKRMLGLKTSTSMLLLLLAVLLLPAADERGILQTLTCWDPQLCTKPLSKYLTSLLTPHACYQSEELTA
jgi:hypothetical protein